ncbi:protein EARLY FLOWERING 5-like [Bidens hawaiensis]|uniref:protein EARLY FLOWERING 5-like n=1 Tax=Bidens hawaiensis TaxID=980011 RepID=UPI00404A7AFF
MKTTKGGKVMNPTDAYRKELRKKELKRNKKERKKVREVGILKKDPETLKEQIDKLEAMKADGALDKARKHKKRQLEDTLNLVLKKRKEYEEKMKEKGEAPVMFSHLGPPRRRTAEEEERAKHPQPEDSVYYHPQWNPTGAPPPGKPPMYKSSLGPIIPLVEGSSSGAGALDDSDDVGSSVPPPPPPPPLPQTGGESESIEDAPPLPPPPPMPAKPATSDLDMLPPPPPMPQPPLPPGTAGADREKSQSDDPASTKLPPPPPPPGLPPNLTGNEGGSEPKDFSKMVPPPPPPRQPPPVPGPGMVQVMPTEVLPLGIAHFPPPPPGPPPLGISGQQPPPMGMMPPMMPRPPFGPPPMMRPPLPPGPPPPHLMEEFYRPTVPQKPSYVKSAASTVVKRPLAQHTPQLTAMVPASVRVRRESTTPKAKPKPSVSSVTVVSQPAPTPTVLKPSTVKPPSSSVAKPPSVDDSYMAFLEDMKALGALDN